MRALLARRLAIAAVPTAAGLLYLRPSRVSAQEQPTLPAPPAAIGKAEMGAARMAAIPAEAEASSLPMWQRLANTISYHPAKTIFGMALPLYCAVFAYESYAPATRDLILSQRLIHTRVYGQGIAVMTTIAVMSILNAETKRGGPFGHVARDGKLKKEYSVSAEHYGQLRRPDNQGAAPEETYGLKWDVMVPLIYMPLLPLLVIGLRNRVSKDTLNKVRDAQPPCAHTPLRTRSHLPSARRPPSRGAPHPCRKRHALPRPTGRAGLHRRCAGARRNDHVWRLVDAWRVSPRFEPRASDRWPDVWPCPLSCMRRTS